MPDHDPPGPAAGGGTEGEPEASGPPGEEASASTGELPVAAVAAPRKTRRARRRQARKDRRAARSRLRKNLTRAGIALLVLIVVVGGSGLGYAIYQVNRIGRVKVNGLTKLPTKGKQAGTENILLVGSTDRCAVAAAKHFENFVQQCQAGVNGINSDVVMILRLSPHHPATLLSIPRDTFVPDAREGGQANKIDAALYNGPSQLVAAIQEDFGIPINHYVVLNFESFANIVTALGGITMEFPTSLYDPDSGLDISHSGCLHISGLEALALVRARHMSYDYDKKTGKWLGYDPTGDIGRIERVHLFLKALAQEVGKRGLGNPVTDSSLLSALAPDLTVDTTFGTREMVSLLLDYHGALAGSQQQTLPVVEDSNDYYDYKGGNYNAVVFPVEPQDSEAIEAFMGGPPDLPPPSKVRVAVVDGTGSASATQAAVGGLRSDGFKVTGVSSQAPVGPISEATVVYNGRAHLAQAERVLQSLRGTAVLAKGKPPVGTDVILVTGSNSVVVHQGAPATGQGAGTSTSTTASGSASRPGGENAALSAVLASVLVRSASPVPGAGSVLSAPLASNPAIPAYDPRPCPGG